MIHGFIYKIVNNVNDIIYVGQTTENLNKRFFDHKYKSKSKKSYFYEEMLKIGTNNFEIVELEKVFGKDNIELKLNLIQKETQYINSFRNNDIKLYNIYENVDNLKLHKNSKKIIELDFDDNIIKIWSSTAEVDRFYNKNMHSNISKCCNNKQKTAYKSKWQYCEN